MDFLRNLGDIGLFIHAMIDAIIFPIPALFSQLSLSALSPDDRVCRVLDRNAHRIWNRQGFRSFGVDQDHEEKMV
jgi:hypothetical protein